MGPITQLARERGVDRLVHLTPAVNLPSILATARLLPTADLIAEGIWAVRPDPDRLEARMDCVCLSVQFPNVFLYSAYLPRVPFDGWVCLRVDIDVLDRPGVGFCVGNAAGSSSVSGGPAGFQAMYRSVADGWSRAPRHHPAAPTNMQAEVLVPGLVPLSQPVTVTVPDETAIRQHRRRLSQTGIDAGSLAWKVRPTLFDPGRLREVVRGTNAGPG